MGKGQVHLIVPGFVNGCKVFCKLLNKWNEDETNETVRNATFQNNELDLFDQANSDDCDQSYSNHERNSAFGECELSLGETVLVT